MSWTVSNLWVPDYGKRRRKWMTNYETSFVTKAFVYPEILTPTLLFW